MSARKDLAVPPGTISIERTHGEWLMVRIGRGGWTKIFNLSETEARKLLALLSEKFADSP